MPYFDREGGELGRAPCLSVTALEMQIIIPHVASILSDLAANSEKDYYRQKPYYYAFELFTSEKDAALLVMRSLKLPPQVQWYETDKISLFEIRGPSGGIVSKYICYLITKG